MNLPTHTQQNVEEKILSYATQTIRRVSATDPAELDDLLNSALEGLIPAALALNQGIRVTRVGPGEYLVEAAPDVQCGYTLYKEH